MSNNVTCFEMNLNHHLVNNVYNNVLAANSSQRIEPPALQAALLDNIYHLTIKVV